MYMYMHVQKPLTTPKMYMYMYECFLSMYMYFRVTIATEVPEQGWLLWGCVSLGTAVEEVHMPAHL